VYEYAKIKIRIIPDYATMHDHRTKMGLSPSTPKSLGPLPVWAVTQLISHPVQDLLHKRLRREGGVFLFYGAWGSGKHHYMLEEARDMRENSRYRDAHWVGCGSRGYEDDMIPWLARMVLKEPESKSIKTAAELVNAMPKDRAATIFLHHSELLFIDQKRDPVGFFRELADAIKSLDRPDINIIFANSRPETANWLLACKSPVQLLGPPDCSRWREEHVRAFVEQRAKTISEWSEEDKDRLVQLGTTIGSVGFIEVWMHSDPKKLDRRSAEREAEILGKRWNELDELLVS
jgi:hypothetical protein